MKTKTLFAAMSFLTICSMAAQAQIPQQSIRWDKHSLIFDGKRVVPVMGEVHYSRIPQNEWREEVRKMKEGGVTMIAAYVCSTGVDSAIFVVFLRYVSRKRCQWFSEWALSAMARFAMVAYLTGCLPRDAR